MAQELAPTPSCLGLLHECGVETVGVRILCFLQALCTLSPGGHRLSSQSYQLSDEWIRDLVPTRYVESNLVLGLTEVSRDRTSLRKECVIRTTTLLTMASPQNICRSDSPDAADG